MDEIKRKLRVLRAKASVSIILLILLIFGSIPVFITLGAYGLILLALAVPVGFYAGKASKKYVQFYKKNVVETVLASYDKMEDLTFSPDDGITKDEIDATGMLLVGNTFSSNDLLCGKRHGVAIKQNDVTVSMTVNDSSGSTDTTLFRGRWLTLALPCETEDLLVVSKKFTASRCKNGWWSIGHETLPSLEVDGEEFTKEFNVYGKDGASAGILNERLKAALLAFREDCSAPVMVKFSRSGICVAVQTNRDAFDEVKLVGKVDPEKETEKVIADLDSTVRFIDAVKAGLE